MIGRVFLIVILCGVCFVAYRFVGVFGGESDSVVVEKIPDMPQVKQEVEERPQVVQVEPSVQEIDEVVVLASGRDFVQVEKWGIVNFGELMPCGGVLHRIKGRALSVFRDGREVVVYAANTAKLMADRTASQVVGAVSDAPVVAGVVKPNPLPAFGGLFGAGSGPQK